MAVYTYLIRSVKNKLYYVGISKDPIKRLAEHNRGKLRATSILKPYALVYCKRHASYLEARMHEKWLKKKNRMYKEKLAPLAPPIVSGVK